jgi:hypothetical protein
MQTSLYILIPHLTNPPLPIRHSLKLDIPPAFIHRLDASVFQPTAQVLALTYVEDFEISASFDDGLDASTCYAHAAAHTQIAEFEKM